MDAQILVRRTLKIAAILSATSLAILSLGAFLVAGSMGASPLEQPRWGVAVIVLPVIATAFAILGSLRERSSFTGAAASYLVAVSMSPIWILLTR